MPGLSILAVALIFGCLGAPPPASGMALGSHAFRVVRSAPGGATQTKPGAGQLLARGDYKAAIETAEAALSANAADITAQTVLISAEIETGNYSEAEGKLKQYLGGSPNQPALLCLYGRLLTATGRYSAAATAFERACGSAQAGVYWLGSIVSGSEALLAEGKEDEAFASLQRLASYGSPNGMATAAELCWIARGLALLERYKEANEFYIDARSADPSYLDAYIGQGNLLAEKYNYGEAASLFDDALKINANSVSARLGLARCRDAGRDPETEIEKALAVNPNSSSAIAIQAGLDLEDDNIGAARSAAARALEINPGELEALAVQAAIAYLSGDAAGLSRIDERALAVNPRAGQFFDSLAHFAIINRRYAAAVEFEKRAVQLSPRRWSARTELGIELLRTGQEPEGREELELAFAKDPYNLWAKNTLDLLDSMKDYKQTVEGPFVIKCSAKDAPAVAGYAGSLLEKAYASLTSKYHFTPKGPITVEIFPNHEDFAVRSLGLPGLGALGVCFGSVIAMDSPSAREAGHFNWGSTLWHEFTHVITLQTTDYRIPRWFSEGLSVYEERHSLPGWGEHWSRELVAAYYKGRFAKIADLDAAFTRPASPDQVPLAYFQASLVCDFVESKYGFPAILKMLDLYRRGESTQGVLKEALGLGSVDFDKGFSSYVEAAIAGYRDSLGLESGGVSEGVNGLPQSAEAPGAASHLSVAELLESANAHPNDYVVELRLGAAYKAAGDAAHAIERFKKAIELFPYYSGPGNPYEELAAIYKTQGNRDAEAAALRQLASVDDTALAVLKRLAALDGERHDLQGEKAALDQCLYIYPFDPLLHSIEGQVYLDLGDPASAVREFRTVVDLSPVDEAAAHYDVARALAAAGKPDEARTEVLKSLEIAPEFDKAQELLLKLKGIN